MSSFTEAFADVGHLVDSCREQVKDDEAAHGYEDKAAELALRWIAFESVCPHARALASLALETRELQFAR